MHISNFYRQLSFTITILINTHIFAQHGIHPAAEVANVEKEFAKNSITTNTRDAFLKYYADEVMIFRKGKAVSGKKTWMERKQDSGLLSWHPVFADVSSSRDFGYTTGPWEYKVKRTDSQPSFFGYYNSVWKKSAEGKWQVIIDIGIEQSASSMEKDSGTSYSRIKSSLTKGKTISSLKTKIISVENKFIRDYKKNKNSFKNYLSKEVRIYRPGKIPLINLAAAGFLIADSNKISYKYIDGNISSAGDLAYVYGSATVETKTKDHPNTNNVGYFRIWKKEFDGKWRIVLDVISDN